MRTPLLDAAETARPRPLRFITCGSVDDGKSTLIGRLLYEQNLVFDDQLAALERDTVEAWHDRRGDRFRPARRRARGRAPAGHHDRCRLPLLQDEEALVHRRRHARPRAIHPQHGDRRLRRRSGHPAGRRAQGPADADASPRDDRLAARHQARGAGRQQDRPHVLRRRPCSTTSSPISARFAEKLAFEDVTAIPLSARNGDNLSIKSSSNTPWYDGPDPGRAPGAGGHLRRAGDAAVPHAGAMAINRPNLDFRGFAGHRRQQAASRRATRSWSPAQAVSPQSSASSRRTATSRFAEAGDAVTLTLADEVDVARGDVLAHCPTRGRRSPIRLPPT